MSDIRRLAQIWTGAAVMAAVLAGDRVASANQPVHEVQVVASRFG